MAGYRDFLIARGLLQAQAQAQATNQPVPSPGLGMGGPIPQTPRQPVQSAVPVLRRIQPRTQPVAPAIPISPTGGGPMQSQAIPSQGQMAYAQQANRINGVPGGQTPGGGILNDPLYAQMTQAGAEPMQAAALVLRDRESKAQEAQRAGTMAELGQPQPGGNDPFVSAIQNPEQLIEFTDMARQWNTGNVGESLWNLANGTPDNVTKIMATVPVGMQFVQGMRYLFENDPELVAKINAAFESGGGRAVWENVIAAASDDLPWYLRIPIRGLSDILVDPLGAPLMIATGGGGALRQAALKSAIEGKTARAALEEVGGRLLQAPQRILDASIDAPFNVVGDLISEGITRLRGGRLLDDAASEVIEDTRSGVGEAVTSYERGMADMPSGTLADTPPTVADIPDPTIPAPTVGGRYTKVEMDVPGGGRRWVILDPQGNPVDELPWRPAKAGDTEPNYAARVADKRVNELNRPQEVEGLQRADVIVPPESWGWMDPTQNRLTTAGADRTSRGLLSTVVFDRRRVPAETAQQIVDDITPAVQEHIKVLDDISREVDDAIKRAGFSGEDAVQRGTDLADPRKTREMVRFYAEDVLPTWTKYMGDAPADPYVFRYGDVLDTTNINNVIEHAVFGTNEQAIAARKYLRANKVNVGPDTTSLKLAQQATTWRKALFGEGALSQDPTAVKSRRIRENRALEPVPNEAALTEMGLGPVKPATRGANDQPVFIGTERDISVNSRSTGPNMADPVVRKAVEDALKTPKPPRTKAAKRIPQRLNLGSLTDKQTVDLILDPDVRALTPAGYRIERAQAGQFTVYSSRRADRDLGRVTIAPKPRGESGWVVTADAGTKRLAETDTLADAVAVADARISGRPMPNVWTEESVWNQLRQPPRYPMQRTQLGDPARYVPPPPRKTPVRRGVDVIKPTEMTDQEIVSALSDTTKRYNTPTGLRVEMTGRTSLKVRPIDSKSARIAGAHIDRAPDDRWRISVFLEPGQGQPAPTYATSLAEAVQAAERSVNSALGRQAPDGLGIVPADLTRQMAMEPGINRGILRDAGALQGAGGDAIADTTPIGEMVNRGAIDRETYDRLAMPVEFEGDVVPLYQAYDMLVMQTGDPAEARRIITSVVAPLDDETFRSAGKAKKLLIAYDKSLQVLREQMQYNVARGGAAAIADQVGNSYTLLITGRPVEALKIWNPYSWMRIFQSERGAADALNQLPGMDRLQRLNVTPPSTVTQMHLGRTETGAGQMALREGMQKVGLTGRVSGTAYGVLANKTIRDFRNAMDRNARWVLFNGEFDRALDNSRFQFYGMVQERARKLGKNAVETDLWTQAARELGDTFTPEDVRRVLGDERLARDWRQLITGAKKTAADSVNERLFSYRQTNADALLRRLVFFHYWQSRALLLHTRVTLQNPWLMNTYARAWENLKQEAEERNYPDSIKGYLNVMGGPTGFYGLLNPLGVLVPFTMLTEAAQDDDGVWEWIRRHGLFINPLIEGAATAIGWGNQVPDLTGTRAVRRAVLATINAMNASGLNRLAPGEANTYQTDQVDAFAVRVAETINRYGSQLPIPGATDQDFGNTAGYEMDQLASVLITIAEDQFGPMDQWSEQEWDDYTAAITAIQTGQNGNDLADDAIEQYTEAKLTGTLASVVVPGGILMRYGPRDTDMATSRAGYDALDTPGAQPTPEQQAAMDRRSTATAGSPEDITLDREADAYREMGTARQQSLSEGWNSVAFGPDENVPDYYVMTIAGTTTTAGDLRGMSDDDRMALADSWIAEVGGTEELEAYRAERKAYIASHPEYGQFEEWKDIAYGYEGGLRAFRTDRAKGNPAFRDAVANQKQYLLDNGTDAALVEDELDQWAASLAGYKAAQGIRSNIYDQSATDTGDQGTVNTILRAGGGGSGSGGGSSAPKSTSAKLRADMAEYQKDLAVFDQILVGVGIEGGFANINNPVMLRSLETQFGDVMPSMSSLLRQYLEWADAVARYQPGADTSIEAFARVIDQMERDAAA